MSSEEGTNVRSKLERYLNRGWIVELMYLSRIGEMSKRRVQIIKIQGDVFQAYCFKRNSKRTFLIENVLALVPVIPRERGLAVNLKSSPRLHNPCEDVMCTL